MYTVNFLPSQLSHWIMNRWTPHSWCYNYIWRRVLQWHHRYSLTKGVDWPQVMLWHFLYQRAMKFHLGPLGHSYLSWRSIYLRVPPALSSTSLTSMVTYTMLFWHVELPRIGWAQNFHLFPTNSTFFLAKHQWRFGKQMRHLVENGRETLYGKWAQI